MSESKQERFRRLAKKRGNRIIRDLNLLGNLSNRSYYEYSDQEVRKLFTLIEDEMKSAKSRFKDKKKREVSF